MPNFTRTTGRITAVGALALLLGGMVAAPAAARPRSPANDVVLTCMLGNGDPIVFEYMGVVAVGCDLPEGAGDDWTWTSSD
jgi:hypothetical protein